MSQKYSTVFVAKESKMSILKANWWKLICIVLITLVTRVLLLQLLPLRSSSTFELPLSIISQKIGMIPTAAIVVTLSLYSHCLCFNNYSRRSAK